MLQTEAKPQAGRSKEDLLVRATERLHQALGAQVPGREREWAEDVSGALTGLEALLRQHAAAAEAPDGLFAEIDLTRPTLVRRAGELRQEHGSLLEQTRGLLGQVAKAAGAFQGAGPCGAEPAALPAPPAVNAVTDLGALREGGLRLANALAQHRERESRLLIESVTTDLGAGD